MAYVWKWGKGLTYVPFNSTRTINHQCFYVDVLHMKRVGPIFTWILRLYYFIDPYTMPMLLLYCVHSIPFYVRTMITPQSMCPFSLLREDILLLRPYYHDVIPL